MRLAKFTTLITTSALSVSPAMAAPLVAGSGAGHRTMASPSAGQSAGQSAARLSLAKSIRTGGQATSRDKLAGGGGFVVAILAAAAIIAGIVIVAESDDESASN